MILGLLNMSIHFLFMQMVIHLPEFLEKFIMPYIVFLILQVAFRPVFPTATRHDSRHSTPTYLVHPHLSPHPLPPYTFEIPKFILAGHCSLLIDADRERVNLKT